MTRSLIRLLSLAFVLLFLTAVGRDGFAADQQLTPEQRAIYAAAIVALEAGRPDEAQRLAATGGHALADKVVRWLEFQMPRASVAFEEIAAFIDANPDWPGQEVLARRAEEAMFDSTPDAVVRAWFASRKPVSADGAARLAEALIRAGDTARVTTLVRETWRNAAMGERQEKFFRARHGDLLRQSDHEARLDNALWDGRRDEAMRMLPIVSPGARALADARIKLATTAAGAEGAVARVPQNLRNDPGLVLERVRWRRRKGLTEDARDLLLNAPKNLGRPEAWWKERSSLAREALAAGRPQDAYRMVRAHGMDGGSAFAEAEWMAGWIALRFLKDETGALKHFTKLHAAVRYPVSLARGAYWAGRAAEARGDRRSAQAWYRQGADYMTTYYGQLAWARLEAGARPPWPQTPKPSGAEQEKFARNELVLAAKLLHEIGRTDRAKPFLHRLAAIAPGPATHAMVGDLAAVTLQRPDLAVSVAKRSLQAGVALPEHGYPVLSFDSDEGLERPLILATIRQESAFESDAVSRAGARGLMQLMPATARFVARQIGVPHQPHQLTSDTSHNVRLGSAYLAGLVADFEGSYVLALAGYNAGPGRPRQWMRDFGDPRQPGVDAVDWIEMIPFDETRNYVQRVLENLQVYRHRLGNPVVALGLDQDLRRGR